MKQHRSPFPRFVHSYRDRHGKMRSAFRRGEVRVPLPTPALGPTWWDAYHRALSDFIAGRESERPALGAERSRVGTVGHAFAHYVASASFKNDLAAATQRLHFGALSRWRDAWADHRIAHIEARHVVTWLDERRDTPAGAQIFFKALRRFLQYCVDASLIKTDPTQGLKRPRFKSDGYHTWTDEEIEQYRRRWKLGGTERLALELLLDTGQRQGDVVRMRPQDIRGDTIHVRQQKTGKPLDLVMGPELLQAIAAMPPRASDDVSPFLLTHWGRPFVAITDSFREWANEAGLPHCSAHGLRKACDRQLAEAGATAPEIASVTGQSLKLVQHYIKAADQGLMSRAAQAKRRTRIGVPTPGDSKRAS